MGIQIETARAVEEVDAIAAIDGVDFLFVGPADLSQALGVTGAYTDPRCLDALDRVAAACEAHDKHWGAVTPYVDYTTVILERGCTLISPTSDVKLLSDGLGAVKEDYAQLW